MENNTENNLANSSNFLENINPKTPTECKIEFEKAKKMAYEGVMAMGKIAHIYKTNFCNSSEDFALWCNKELSYSPRTVNNFIRNYEIFSKEVVECLNYIEKMEVGKLNAINSLCEYEYKYYEDNKKLSTPKIDTDTEGRRKFNTFHMDNFIEQYKDNLEDITLQDLKALVKEYKITNDLIKEKKEALKESEQKLADTYKELESHDVIVVKIVEPTCFKPGYTIYHCNVCNVDYTDDHTDEIQHDYSKGDTCSYCGKSQ